MSGSYVDMSRTRRLALSTIAAASSALVVSAPAAPAAAKPSCFEAKGKTVAIHRTARLFTTNRGRILRGCVAGRAPRRITASTDNGFDAGEFVAPKLSGVYVAYGYTLTAQSCKASCPPDFDTDAVLIFNLTTGRKVEAKAWTDEPFVLTATGAVAWISQSGNPSNVNVFYKGALRQPDSGAIQRDSLEASRTRVSWIKDGTIHAASYG